MLDEPARTTRRKDASQPRSHANSNSLLAKVPFLGTFPLGLSYAGHNHAYLTGATGVIAGGATLALGLTLARARSAP